MIPFTITPSDPLGKFLLPIPVTLSSVGLEVLVPEQEVFLLGNTTNILLTGSSDFPLVTLGFRCP